MNTTTLLDLATYSGRRNAADLAAGRSLPRGSADRKALAESIRARRDAWRRWPQISDDALRAVILAPRPEIAP